jgi:hypothetical protein
MIDFLFISKRPVNPCMTTTSVPIVSGLEMRLRLIKGVAFSSTDVWSPVWLSADRVPGGPGG